MIDPLSPHWGRRYPGPRTAIATAREQIVASRAEPSAFRRAGASDPFDANAWHFHAWWHSTRGAFGEHTLTRDPWASAGHVDCYSFFAGLAPVLAGRFDWSYHRGSIGAPSNCEDTNGYWTTVCQILDEPDRHLALRAFWLVSKAGAQ